MLSNQEIKFENINFVIESMEKNFEDKIEQVTEKIAADNFSKFEEISETLNNYGNIINDLTIKLSNTSNPIDPIPRPSSEDGSSSNFGNEYDEINHQEGGGPLRIINEHSYHSENMNQASSISHSRYKNDKMRSHKFEANSNLDPENTKQDYNVESPINRSPRHSNHKNYKKSVSYNVDQQSDDILILRNEFSQFKNGFENILTNLKKEIKIISNIQVNRGISGSEDGDERTNEYGPTNFNEPAHSLFAPTSGGNKSFKGKKQSQELSDQLARVEEVIKAMYEERLKMVENDLKTFKEKELEKELSTGLPGDQNEEQNLEQVEPAMPMVEKIKNLIIENIQDSKLIKTLSNQGEHFRDEINNLYESILDVRRLQSDYTINNDVDKLRDGEQLVTAQKKIKEIEGNIKKLKGIFEETSKGFDDGQHMNNTKYSESSQKDHTTNQVNSFKDYIRSTAQQVRILTDRMDKLQNKMDHFINEVLTKLKKDLAGKYAV